MFGQVRAVAHCVSVKRAYTHTGIQRMAASSHTYISFNTYSGTYIRHNETCLCCTCTLRAFHYNKLNLVQHIGQQSNYTCLQMFILLLMMIAEPYIHEVTLESIEG